MFQVIFHNPQNFWAPVTYFLVYNKIFSFYTVILFCHINLLYIVIS